MQDVRCKNYSFASREYPDADDLQEPMIKEVLEVGDIPQIWDGILVDEAQDFGPKFLNMCREAITEENRLIWAYDEAHDLSSLTAPSRKTCLGSMGTEMQSSTSAGSIAGPQKTFVMRKSYRAPRLLLILAHTIGMGLKREDGSVQAITRQDGWDGYDVDGNFRKIGSEAVLRRPVENSPHPMQNELFPGELIAHRSIETMADEHWVSKKIKADIQQEGLDPGQILVIPLCKGRTNDIKIKSSLLRNWSRCLAAMTSGSIRSGKMTIRYLFTRGR